jgi:hypothetical protein
VSACFFLFEAAKKRFVVSGAKVGVHSFWDVRTGKEDNETLAYTARLVRFFKKRGVPDSVLVGMITANPGEIYWLTEDDLKAMKVASLNSDDPASAPSSESADALAYYASRSAVAGYLYRAASACPSVYGYRRPMERVASDLLNLSYLQSLYQALPVTVHDWGVKGAKTFDNDVMAVGLYKACGKASKTLIKVQESLHLGGCGYYNRLLIC